MQRPGLHLAQRCSLRVGGDGVPGDVSRCGRLGSGGPAALHDRRLLRQEAARAQDGEQEAAQAQVRRPQILGGKARPRNMLTFLMKKFVCVTRPAGSALK